MNLKGYGKKQSWLYAVLAFTWRKWGNPWKIPFSIASPGSLVYKTWQQSSRPLCLANMKLHMISKLLSIASSCVKLKKSSTWERVGFMVLTTRCSGFPALLAITLRYCDCALSTWDLNFSRLLLRRLISSGVWNHVDWLQTFREKPTISVHRAHRVRR
jgi:hypothetical protein